MKTIVLPGHGKCLIIDKSYFRKRSNAAYSVVSVWSVWKDFHDVKESCVHVFLPLEQNDTKFHNSDYTVLVPVSQLASFQERKACGDNEYTTLPLTPTRMTPEAIQIIDQFLSTASELDYEIF